MNWLNRSQILQWIIFTELSGQKCTNPEQREIFYAEYHNYYSNKAQKRA